MAQTLIISHNSEILHHPSTQTLHTYGNGDVLVTTDAPLSETENSKVIPVKQGIVLPKQNLLNSLLLSESNSQFHTQFNTRSDADRSDRPEDTEPINAYIELIGPVDPDWMTVLDGLGIELLQYQPENSYLSCGTRAAFQRALQQPFILNVIPVSNTIKPATLVPESGEQDVYIVVQGDRASAPAILQELASLPDVSLDLDQQIDIVNFYLRIRAQVTAIGQDALLHHPKVLAVESYIPPQLEDEVAGLIIAGQYDAVGKPNGSYLNWLEDQGLNGSGVTIGIVDAGVDGSHAAFGDRTKDLCSGRKSWHGTFVAGHAAGCYLAEQDGNQFIYGLGVAPKANVLIQYNQNSATSLCQETVTETIAGIAGTIQNNSWGSGTADPMTYGSLEATYDKLVRHVDPDSPSPKPLTICFSSGNSGSAGLTRPKAAKNLIVTGNSETYRPEVGRDQSDNINEVYTGLRGSSHGNCGDGRIVPHLVAPGEWTASANYDSHPGEREYISPKLTWGGGSSAASPKTAGACALLTQWWRRNNYGSDPSPAMLKALIVNGAEPIQSGGAIPNKLQGWGRLNLSNILSTEVHRFYLDQTVRLTQRGEQKTWTIRISNPQKPLKITLCWTDPPAAIGTGTAQASAIVNKLALRVEARGTLYRANQFQNGWSVASGSGDREGWDNLQNIYLPAGNLPNTVQVSVIALDLTTNCLTGRISPPQQDFALVITNGALDQSSTSADLFVAVDPATQPDLADSSNHFWQQENQDEKDLDQAWWNTVQPSKTVPGSNPANPANPPQSSQADLWWLQSDVWWKKAETEREQDNQTNHLMQSLQTATTVVGMAGQHQVLTADRTLAESYREGENTLVEIKPEINQITSQNASVALPGAVPLSQALAQLMQNWNHFGTAHPDRQQAAVLVVRSTTRISPQDLAALRRLAFVGQLYLVSDYAPILAFLAQRIHSSTGLQLRLANDSQALETLVQETLIEASGAQQAEVDDMTEPLPDAIVTHHLFQVVSADRHVTIQIRFPVSVNPTLQLIAPDQTKVAIDPSAAAAPVSMTFYPGGIQLDLEANRFSRWAGQWKLLLKQPGHQNLSRVQVWVWSALQWQFRPQKTTVQAETDRNHNELLLAVSGSEVSLSRLQSQPCIISNSAIVQESDRILEVQAELPRLERDRKTEASQRQNAEPVYAPTLSAMIRSPQIEETVVIDLPLRVEGIDPLGDRFVRLLRTSILQLQPRSRQRQQWVSPQIIFTSAQIAGVQMEENELRGLTLKRGDRTRRVKITSPHLRQQLAHALQHDFPNQELIVGVVGNELYGIYCPLQQSSVRQFVQLQL